MLQEKNKYICSRKTKDNVYSINELKKTHDFVRAKSHICKYQGIKKPGHTFSIPNFIPQVQRLAQKNSFQINRRMGFMANYHKTPLVYVTYFVYKIWDVQWFKYLNPKANTSQLQTQLWVPMQLLSFIRSSILIFSRNSKRHLCLIFKNP